MNPEETYTIRKVQRQDIEQLKKFFIKAYNADTVFQSMPFLEWYFNPEMNNCNFMNECIVGISKSGQIISHYGGLKYSLKLGDKRIPLVWGVNAYTLPEWRGKGINSKIVDYINNNYEINGVIGFKKKTSEFYSSIGYNLFESERFSRYIYILDRYKTIETMKFIGQTSEKLDEAKLPSIKRKKPTYNTNIIQLNKENINNFDIDFDIEIFATTIRDKKFINWRLLHNPFIEYTVYGFIEDERIVAYIAYREEVLYPLKYTANRIIDIFGTPRKIPELLSVIIQNSILKGVAYIDFSMFGNLYEEVLNSMSFRKLEGEHVTILPQVTCPIGYRDNEEYIGFSSQKYKDDLNLLSKNNTYFTRIDSDRDRLAKYSQIIVK